MSTYCTHPTALVCTLASRALNLERDQALLQWYNNYRTIKPTKMRQLQRIARLLLRTRSLALCSSALRQLMACATCEERLLAAAGT